MKMKMSLYSTVMYEFVTPALGVVVILLNILEAVLIKKSKHNSKGSIYLMSLAVSDILAGVIMVILKTMHQFMKTDLKGNIYAEEIYHVIKHAFIRFSLFISIFNLLAIAIDRYIAISHPMFHRNKRVTLQRTLCISTWMVSLACVTAAYCASRFGLADVRRYNDLLFPVSAYLSAVLLISLYSMIFKAISNSRKSSRTHSKQSEVNKMYLVKPNFIYFFIFFLHFYNISLYYKYYIYRIIRCYR